MFKSLRENENKREKQREEEEDVHCKKLKSEKIFRQVIPGKNINILWYFKIVSYFFYFYLFARRYNSVPYVVQEKEIQYLIYFVFCAYV